MIGVPTKNPKAESKKRTLAFKTDAAKHAITYGLANTLKQEAYKCVNRRTLSTWAKRFKQGQPLEDKRGGIFIILFSRIH
jgi:hypothetical protein